MMLASKVWRTSWLLQHYVIRYLYFYHPILMRCFLVDVFNIVMPSSVPRDTFLVTNIISYDALLL